MRKFLLGVALFLVSLYLVDNSPSWFFVLWLAFLVFLTVYGLRNTGFDDLGDAIDYCQAHGGGCINRCNGKYITTVKPSGNYILVTKTEAYFTSPDHTNMYKL